MRKFVKLMTIATISTTAALQVTACKDDSKYDAFISDVNNSFNNNTAFFGFLGSKDDNTSNILQTTIDSLNNKTNGDSLWDIWLDSINTILENSGLKTIQLKYYQGPYHQDKPSDPVSAFWNDKSISWQQNIFTWVNSRANLETNPDFQLPSGLPAVLPIETIEDDNDNDMFTALPIIFIISKGKLITAGQNWLTDENPNKQYDAIQNFILTNLFLS